VGGVSVGEIVNVSKEITKRRERTSSEARIGSSHNNQRWSRLGRGRGDDMA